MKQISIQQDRELLTQLGYPPARIATATAHLLGDEAPVAVFTEMRAEDERSFWRLILLTETRLILTEGEGPAGWELHDTFSDHDSASARAWGLGAVQSIATQPGKEWNNLTTLYSSLGVAIRMADGAEVCVPEGKFPDQGGRDQIDAFVEALISAHIGYSSRPG
jgi:hypothetical protein